MPTLNINKNCLFSFHRFLIILVTIILVSFSNIKILYGENLENNVYISSQIEKDFATKYCDSIDKKLFTGLDNELILKLKYLFNSIKSSYLKENPTFKEKVEIEIFNNCKYDLSNYEKEELFSFIKEITNN